MFDLSWSEIALIGAAAIIFIGPKELPGALRTLGKFVSKARSMAREFQSNVEEMVREAELDEVKKQVQKLETGEVAREIEKSIDPKGEITSALSPPDVSSLGLTAAPAPLPSPSPSAPTTTSATEPLPPARAPGTG